MAYDVENPLKNAKIENHRIDNIRGSLRPQRSAAIPAPRPPTSRNINVTVPRAPARARSTAKLFWMSIRMNVMIVKSNPSSSQPKKVARNAFHCSPSIWRYQGGSVRGVMKGGGLGREYDIPRHSAARFRRVRAGYYCAVTVTPLEPTALFTPCRNEDLSFETTAALEPQQAFPGQDRAVGAIEFGVGIRHEGYNLFAVGAPGSGRHSLVQTFLKRQAARSANDSDWCYLYNFVQPHRPCALELPAGRASEFSTDMRQLVDDLQGTIVAAFETEEYRARQRELEGEFSAKQEEVLEEVRVRAAKKGLAILRTPAGVAVAPTKDGEVVDLDTFKKAPEDEQARIRSAIAELEGELGQVFQQVPLWRRESSRKLQRLKDTVTRSAVQALVEELLQKYEPFDDVVTYLKAVQSDIVENAEYFLKGHEETDVFALWRRRYSVNVLTDASADGQAPVVYETNPTLQNLIGRIEHQTQAGTLLTDFTMIKSGALHRANGGYLILDANRLLMQPLAWDAVKRALQSRQIKTESPDRLVGILNTVSLEPEPIPLDLKVVLVGDHILHHLLCLHDPDFGELFKVAADFDDVTARNPVNTLHFARLIAGVVQNDSLRPLGAEAVARVVEDASRRSGDAERLSANMRELTELLKESDYWAEQDAADTVAAAHVQRALDAKTHRQDRVRERMQEAIARGTILIDTSGETVGQVNGLSVLQTNGFSFGNPNRITARVRLGSGSVIDIEREVRLGGPLHSKGVLILSGFLSGRYVTDRPLSLSASIVFEQSYGGVDGDSASSAELYAVLSAVAEVPIRQSLAVTGSVSQQGQVQAIGGVNEKIEGFFDICQRRGLSGQEGVVIPASNVKLLMLRADVVNAAHEGLFHIYPVETIDQGVEVLTGCAAGERDETGVFPEGTINRKVEDRLMMFAEESMAYLDGVDDDQPGGSRTTDEEEEDDGGGADEG